MNIITKDNVHELMMNYIDNNNINIINYDTMTDVYLKMIIDNYNFIIDRELLKGIMIDIAYKYCPNDDYNKELVLLSLSIMEEDSDED